MHKGSVVAAELAEYKTNRAHKAASASASASSSVANFEQEEIFLDIKQCSSLQNEFDWLSRKDFSDTFGTSPEAAKVLMAKATDWKGSLLRPPLWPATTIVPIIRVW